MGSILVNGVAAKSGGGKSILVNFLTLLNKVERNEKYIVVVPERIYSKYSKENVLILHCEVSLFKTFTFYYSTVKKIIRKHNVSLILNLADFIIPVSTRQVYLFDWPYALYPNTIGWERMSIIDKVFRMFKLFLVKHYIHLPALIIAQTTVAKERLKRFLSVENVEVVPNAVSFDNLTGGTYKDFHLPCEKVKFLYLTKYYSHKNIEVFISLAKIIREENLPLVLITTIHEAEHTKAKKFIKAIKQENLDSIILNVGPVNMEHVPSIYQQTDALLMPSLLESFSGTYVEAMHHGKPIFTSDLDFARVVCGDAAYYFDPLHAKSIMDTINLAYSDKSLMESKIALGKHRLNSFLSWRQVFEKLVKILEQFNNESHEYKSLH